MSYADRVAGTKIGFTYEQSGHFDAFTRIRRQAERDAAEVRAVADEHGITRAIGFSRGARAIVGALADGPDLFERVALVIPPGGTAAGKYSTWLDSRPTLAAEVLVLGTRGDQDHPARVATAWAEQLGARVEILGSRAVYTEADRVMDLIADFFN
jgi:pimeloyl-ACP methyl ester carboxylesterase